MGLSDEEREGKLFYDKAHSGAASLHEGNYTGFNRPFDGIHQVKLTTVDKFCQIHNIDHIDLLKIDVEGHEMSVLQGAEQMLSKVRYIQFEMGKTSIASRTFFKDFYDFLSPQFNLYRLLKNGLEPIETYKEEDEIFITVNYLAEAKQQGH